MEENTKVPQKLNKKLSYNTEIILLRIYSRKTKNANLNGQFTLIFRAFMFTIAKRWKQLSIDR